MAETAYRQSQGHRIAKRMIVLHKSRDKSCDRV